MAYLQSLGWYGSAGICVGDRRTEHSLDLLRYGMKMLDIMFPGSKAYG
jgi:hypothetical protein